MRFSYISVLMLLFLLCNVYAINEDAFGLPPVTYEPDNSNPNLPPLNAPDSIIPPLPADFTYILSAGMIGVIIGLLIAALGYMVGNFLMSNEMIGWAKNQLWESLYSMVLISTILVFAISIHLFPFGVPEAVSSNTQISFPQKAALSLDNVINGEIDLANLDDKQKEEFEKLGIISTENMGIKKLFFMAYSHQILINMVYSIVTPRLILGPGAATTSGAGGAATAPGGGAATAPGGGAATTPGGRPTTTETPRDRGATTIPDVGLNLEGNILSGFKKLMNLSGTISNYLLTLLMVLYAQMALLIFISGAGTFLFMLGVFFRCIPFTRKMGSTLIALFITLYFVYPAFVLFAYSEANYGEMNKEFSGIYVEDRWFESMDGINSNGLVVLTPLGINQLESKNLKEGDLVLSFYSTELVNYNYTVSLDDKVVCSGNASLSTIVDCDLKDSIPTDFKLEDSNNIDRQDIDTFDVSEFNKKVKPLNYTIQLNSSSEICFMDQHIISPIDGNVTCKPGYERTEIRYYPKKGITDFQGNNIYYGEPNPLPVSVYIMTECRTDSCHQYISRVSTILENSYQKDRISFLVAPLIEELKSTNPVKTVEDVGVITIKSAITGLTSFYLGSKMGVLTGLYLFKNDISSFMYDEVTCDPYISTAASNYFGGTDSGPRSSTESFGYITDLGSWFRDLQEGIVKTPILRKFFTYYSESDYHSCSNSLGVYDSGQLTAFVTGVLEGWDFKWKNMNMTVLLSPIVYVFIAFIYTLIFCVTFFKSLSGSIGGDASLLGLGKLL